MPPPAWVALFLEIVLSSTVNVCPPETLTPPPLSPTLPEMVERPMVSDDPQLTLIPPPLPKPDIPAKLPAMVEWVMVAFPRSTLIPPPQYFAEFSLTVLSL